MVINELLAASVSPATDFIEFLNTTSDPLDGKTTWRTRPPPFTTIDGDHPLSLEVNVAP